MTVLKFEAQVIQPSIHISAIHCTTPASHQAQELKEVCQDFLGDIGDFQVPILCRLILSCTTQKIADSFIVIFDAVSKEVETEKMKVD